jgi:hypothetical protein
VFFRVLGLSIEPLFLLNSAFINHLHLYPTLAHTLRLEGQLSSSTDQKIRKEAAMKPLPLVCVSLLILSLVLVWSRVGPSPTVPPPAGTVPKATPRPSAKHYIWFIDQSISVHPQKQPQWLAAAPEAGNRLQCGDSIILWGIHDQSQNAAPLYRAEIPAVDEFSTFSEKEKCHRKLTKVRSDLTQIFAAAFHPPQPALSSDYFATLDLIKPDPLRSTIVIYLGDMVHSTQELFLEKVKLTSENIVSILNPVVAQHRWQPGMLRDVQVHCLLNALVSGEPPPLNDHKILGEFWRTLFRSLEADVITFAPYLQLTHP